MASRDGTILEFYNDCAPFLKIQHGHADFNLFSVIDPSLKNDLKAFCHHACCTNEAVASHILQLSANSREYRYRVHVQPIRIRPTNDQLLLIAFEEVDRPNETPEPCYDSDRDAALRIVGLEHELKTTRETLQTLTDALEATIEELQAINEEAQTSNEELQSTNEELETSNEELQSTNEELTIVNEELINKTQELSEVNDDLQNVLNSMQKAVLVVDAELRINRHNEVSNQFFNFAVAKQSQTHLSSLEILFNGIGLIAHPRQVIESGVCYRDKLEIQDRNYELNIYPYRSNNCQDTCGAVLTILDTTEKLQSEQQIHIAASVFATANEAIFITDGNNRIVTVNPAFSQITGHTERDVIGKDPKIISSGRQDKDFYRRMWDSILNHCKWQGKIWSRRRNGQIYPEWLSISTFNNDQGEIVRFIGIFSDITEPMKAQQLIQQQANYDALTRLTNRNLFYDRLQQDMVKAKRAKKLIAIMFIDLDGFKDINDSLGHS